VVAETDGIAKECDLFEAAGAAPDATVLAEVAGAGAGVAGTGAVAAGSPPVLLLFLSAAVVRGICRQAIKICQHLVTYGN
jgi:hypothetical protein